MFFSASVKQVQRLSEFYNGQLPDRYPVGIHKAVLEGNLDMVAQLIVSGEDVNSRDSFHGCTILHLAVIIKNIALLKYFLDMVDIKVDVKCLEGRTPLYVAAALGYLEFAQKLIESGADVNVSDRAGQALSHVAIFHPDVCHLLIRHGVRIDDADWFGITLLHTAVEYKCNEVVHMLLYYNVDTNVTDMDQYTPFMVALTLDYVDVQEALLEYVDDFNRTSCEQDSYPCQVFTSTRYFGSILSFALERNSPFVKDIIERGARVNYGDDPKFMDDSAFSACLQCPVDLATFKLVWEKLQYNEGKNTIDLLDLFRCPEVLPTFLSAIIESDNFEIAVQFFSEGNKYHLFVSEFAEKKFELEQLTALTCRLLEYGFQASSCAVYEIFSYYGYCELFRIMLCMDNGFARVLLPRFPFSRVKFGITYDLKSLGHHVNVFPKDTLLQFLEYSACPRLINALIRYNDESMSAILDKMPRVPFLIELARNAARKHIWQSFKIINPEQLYYTIAFLDMPIVYKNILNFKRKIYRVK